MTKRFNSFVLYCNDHRRMVSIENKGKSNSEITSILAFTWRNIDIETRNYYKKKAEDLKIVSGIKTKFYSKIMF